MNKKILLIIAALLVFSMTVTPLVLAKPGQKMDDKKLYFKLYMEGWIASSDPERSWTTPTTSHTRGADWIPTFIEVTLGSEVIDQYLSYEVELDVNMLVDVRLHVQAKETVYIWNDEAQEDLRGYIELNTKDNFVLTGPSSGTFSGHGMIDGQKVKVVGVSSGYVVPPTRYLTREGTIMGLAP